MTTKQAMEALAAEAATGRGAGRRPHAEEWATASDCDGWRVQDVFAHMASVFHQVADPSSTPAAATDDAEETAELMLVEPQGPGRPARGRWTSTREWSEKALAALGGMQEPPMAEVVIPLGNLGSHPLHLLANAFVFDHYCHLRHDVARAVRSGRPAAAPRATSCASRRPSTWMLGGHAADVRRGAGRRRPPAEPRLRGARCRAPGWCGRRPRRAGSW